MNRKQRILITKDSVDSTSGLQDALVSRGLEVVCAPRDGKRILELLHSPSKFDAALIDFNLAQTDAIGVISEAKSVSPSTKIMVMSAFITGEIERQVFDAGGKYLFLKPFDPSMAAQRLVTLTEPDSEPAARSGFGGSIGETE